METIELLQSVAAPWLDAVMLAVTYLGAQESYIVLLVFVYLAVDARAGRLLGVTLLASYYLNQGMKGAFDTPRPFELRAEVVRSAGAEVTAPGPGFPSGHAQSAATFWPMAAAWWRRWWVGALAVVLVVLIAGSRLYLGVHLPIDVAGGLALGLAAAAAGWAVLRLAGPVPRPVWLAGSAAPLLLHLAFPTPDSGMIAGGIAGFVLAQEIVPHTPRGTAWQRALLTTLGLLLAFGWLAGTSVALPEPIKDHPLFSFLRYLVLALLGLAAAPALGARMGLLPRRA